MKEKDLTFKNIGDLTKRFNTELKCIQFVEKLRWNGERACPHCGGAKTYVCKGHGKYKCAYCRKLFSITTGTYFENTKLPLRVWLISMYLILNHKKGVSSLQLASTIGCTQKSAWFVLHRLRAMLKDKTERIKLSGVIEADEGYIGGLDSNKHASKRKLAPQPLIPVEFQKRKYTTTEKKMVVGAVQRGGLVIAKYIEDEKRSVVIDFLQKHVQEGSTLYTDEHYYYYNKIIKDRYAHQSVNHGVKEYVKGRVHTNTIENYWSVVKRCIDGTYHQLSRKHLQAYLNEFSFRYNTRHESNSFRFIDALKDCHGRLKYKQLIAA
ncbi:MAG: IS1595 family transposase [Bacteroidetes bacterium]|nr:IS1595 family transposase [Bacteroidota bacterium]MBK9671700.1 IS1595 family transposase [Bacteroidota bacterium]